MLEERAHAQIVKNPARKLSAKTHAWLVDTAVSALQKLFSGIAHNTYRDNAAIWLLHHSEPSDY